VGLTCGRAPDGSAFAYSLWHLIFLNAIPYAENKSSSWLQNAASLSISSSFVRKEHHAKLAGIEPANSLSSL
jgi:hypothetical protein